jgi:hypothetical protein
VYWIGHQGRFWKQNRSLPLDFLHHRVDLLGQILPSCASPWLTHPTSYPGSNPNQPACSLVDPQSYSMQSRVPTLVNQQSYSPQRQLRENPLLNINKATPHRDIWQRTHSSASIQVLPIKQRSDWEQIISRRHLSMSRFQLFTMHNQIIGTQDGRTCLEAMTQLHPLLNKVAPTPQGLQAATSKESKDNKLVKSQSKCELLNI